MLESIIPVAATIVGAVLGFSGNIISDRFNAKSQREKLSTELDYDLRKSLRQDLLEQIITFIEVDVAESKSRAEKLNSKLRRIDFQRNRSAEHQKIVDDGASTDHERVAASQVKAGSDQALEAARTASIDAFEDLRAWHTALEAKTIRIGIAAPPDIAASLKKIADHVGALLQESLDEHGFLPENVIAQDQIKQLNVLRDQLVSTVRNWIHK